MAMALAFILCLVNLGISFWNARVTGQCWAESKAVGGWIRILVWCGAIQAAIGFSSVYMFLLSTVCVITGILPASTLSAVNALFYLLIIVPALGTGLIIMIQSWISLYRERSLANLGGAAWNTFAMAYNTYNAVTSIGQAVDIVSNQFGGMHDDDGDSDDNNAKIILLVVFALLAGILTTYVIVRRYEASLPVSEEVREAQSKGTRDLSFR